MAIQSNSSDVEVAGGGRSLFTGIAPVSVIAVNPNLAELNSLGIQMKTEPNYTGIQLGDNVKNKIIVKHYNKDNQPGFIIKGHSSESILLAILKKELISQMSHAGYLGGELSKAEIALKQNLIYTQDQTLRNK